MHWLISFDIGLFHFINGSLSNPFFDWLMPILSGGHGAMRWFIPFAVAAVLGLLCFGNAQARLCGFLITLAVALGDPFIVNTIKHVVARPRPCITLSHVIERLGCTHSGSMPSAHAANWFAAAMIVFLLYRWRSWPMLVMAAAVSFSRVYNGVHYPSDVLAGAILGAGYASALVIVLQAAWNRIGKKWFPLWHAQLPSLLMPKRALKKEATELSGAIDASVPDLQSSNTHRHWLRLGYILIFVLLVGRWIYLASGVIELSQDEAYQWVWSKHLALSYYSKPPGIALIQFAGTALFGDTEFGVRFFSPLFAAILSWMLLRFFAREVGARPAFWLLVAATAVPLLAVGSILMTIDPPLVLCWTWAMIAGWRAAQPDGLTRDWLIVGLAMGLGFLCKYSAAYQLVCWGVFFALAPAARVHLRRPGPWLALLVFLICTLPVVVWNMQHGWITLQDVGGDAGLHSRWRPTLRYFWDFTFSELALLNPFFFIGALWAMLGFWKFRRARPLWLYFFCMGAPVFLGHWLYSLHSRVLPNWIAPAVLPMLCLMVAYWDEKLGDPHPAHRSTPRHAGLRLVRPVFTTAIGLGIFAIAMMYQSNLIGKIAGQRLPGELDPLRRVRAWDAEARLVETAREQLQRQGRPAFIIAGHYGITGLYSFYIQRARAAMKSEPLVYVTDSARPQNQFGLWPEYDYLARRKGQNAIFVSEAPLYRLEPGWFWKWMAQEPMKRLTPPPVKLPARIAQQFQSVTNLGEEDVKVHGRVFHRIHLWACYGLKQ